MPDLSTITAFGGFCDKTLKEYNIVKFIHSNDLSSCKKGNFLIGSVQRNKKFDDERNDMKETSYEYHWENRNKVQWILNEKDLDTFSVTLR